MKKIKNNYLKIAIFLIIIGSMAIVYWLYPNKRFNNNSIPQNADAVAIVDIKSIRNHFIFSYLKHPSQWQLGWNNSGTKKHFDLSNFGIETPDYFSFFHIKNQAFNKWYCIAEIDDEIEFQKNIVATHFTQTKDNKSFISYYSKSLNAHIIRFENQILYCINSTKNDQSIIKIAEDLFVNHSYFNSNKIENLTQNSNAVTFWIQKGELLNEDGIITISLKDKEIVANGKLNWKPKYRKEFSFLKNPNAIVSLGFNFEMIQEQPILKQNLFTINKITGFNLDSLLVHHPTRTEFAFHTIIEKKDSAITYDYDDDFNPIKKVVIHKTREPSFFLSIQTNDSKKVYHYLKKQKAIDTNEVFVNFPLAKTKTFVKNNSLTLEANLEEILTSKPSPKQIGYLQINFGTIKANDWQFLIAKNKNLALFKHLESLEINLTQKNNEDNIAGIAKIKDKKSVFEVFK